MLGSRPPPLTHAPPHRVAVLRERDWIQLRALIKIGPDLRRSLEIDDVAQRLLELRALVVERAARHADADRAEELPLVVEHRRGEAAEVALELLALARHAGQAHLPELLRARLGLRDRGRREAL